MTVYVGVDQALRKMGVCVLVDDKPVVLERLAPPADMRGPERLCLLRDLLYNCLFPYQGQISAAAMEAQSLGSLGDLDQLGQINGIVQVLLRDFLSAPKRLLQVPPAVLKKFVTSHSGATKDDMMAASSRRWGFDFIQYGDDVCDAHGLARMAQEALEARSTLRHEVEAVTTLLRHKTRRPPRKRLFAKTI
jgi:hypothetical protein